MSAAQPEPKPARRGLWLVVVVVIGLLALTTWDVLRNSVGSSPAALRRAAFDGDEATVRRLIAAHPEWIDSVGSTNRQTPLLSGLYEQAMKAIGKSPSSPSPSLEKQFQGWEGPGATPLFYAGLANHIGIARVLLEAGAKVSFKDPAGGALVVYTIQRGDTNFLTALEARAAMLPAAEADYQRWLVHIAVSCGRPEMLQFFIGRGQPVNETDSKGETPLCHAIDWHRLDLVQILTTNGADVTRVTVTNQTALEVARRIASSNPSSNAIAVVTWLEAYTATNQPPAKPVP